MRRRGFLAGLLALPFVAPLARVATAIRARILKRTVFVGRSAGADATTLAEGMAMVEPGGTVYLLPGHVETINEAIIIDKPGLSVIGHPDAPATFKWGQS